MDRITDWALDLTVANGKIERFFPCLSSGPFDEDRRHRFSIDGNDRLAIQSYSSRSGAFRENPNQSVVLEVAGGPDTTFSLEMTNPAKMVTSAKAADLFGGSVITHVGGYPSESYLWHRILPAAAASVEDKCTLAVPKAGSNVYLRVKQKNGHMAWGSPVFVNYR